MKKVLDKRGIALRGIFFLGNLNCFVARRRRNACARGRNLIGISSRPTAERGRVLFSRGRIASRLVERARSFRDQKAGPWESVTAVGPNTFRNVGDTAGAPRAGIVGAASLAAVAPGAGICARQEDWAKETGEALKRIGMLESRSRYSGG